MNSHNLREWTGSAQYLLSLYIYNHTTTYSGISSGSSSGAPPRPTSAIVFRWNWGVGKKFANNRKCQRLRQINLSWVVRLGPREGRCAREEEEEGLLRTVDCALKRWLLIAFTRIVHCLFISACSTPLCRVSADFHGPALRADPDYSHDSHQGLVGHAENEYIYI